jgi:hypothetical protein
MPTSDELATLPRAFLEHWRDAVPLKDEDIFTQLRRLLVAWEQDSDNI